jgi:thioredoxin-like negative regulator of GroEL
LVTDSPEGLAQGQPQEVLVVCLCAQWCNLCGEYQSRFEQVRQRMQTEFAHSRFLWVDVEDEADLLHPLDVENFPTILLAIGGEPRFFGPITPQPSTLERLIQSHASDAQGKPLRDHDLRLVIDKIRAAKLM